MAEPAARLVPRWLEMLFLAALAAGLAYSAWGLWHDRAMAQRLQRIHLGMDRKAAEAVLGRPDWEGACGGRVASLPRAECAVEIGYASAFAPLVGRYYLVQLDRGGRVIEAETVRLPSPVPGF